MTEANEPAGIVTGVVLELRDKDGFLKQKTTIMNGKETIERFQKEEA